LTVKLADKSGPRQANLALTDIRSLSNSCTGKKNASSSSKPMCLARRQEALNGKIIEFIPFGSRLPEHFPEIFRTNF
jgi:hypothetical protein